MFLVRCPTSHPAPSRLWPIPHPRGLISPTFDSAGSGSVQSAAEPRHVPASRPWTACFRCAPRDPCPRPPQTGPTCALHAPPPAVRLAPTPLSSPHVAPSSYASFAPPPRQSATAVFNQPLSFDTSRSRPCSPVSGARSTRARPLNATSSQAVSPCACWPTPPHALSPRL